MLELILSQKSTEYSQLTVKFCLKVKYLRLSNLDILSKDLLLSK